MISKSGIKKNLPVLFAFGIIVILLLSVPNRFQMDSENSLRCKGLVLKTNNSEITKFGMIRKGSQFLTIEILSGEFKGKKINTVNQLRGQLDRDKLFKKGDLAFVVLSLDSDGRIVFTNPQAHYRLGVELFLTLIFLIALVIFGGWTGLRSFFSFIISALVIWKILVPGFLSGYDPVLLAFVVVFSLCALIIFLVAGINSKGFVAFSGAVLGVLASCILSFIFTDRFHIHGAIMPFSETLLYSGFGHLDLIKIYIAGVFIAASGAVMDLAMDVAASMCEIKEKKKDIGRRELFLSGLKISRSVVGTMTTTLLFAYSGGYITLLMAFMAQNIPVLNMLNLIYVSAEILKTLVGSFGLVMVGPFTACVGAIVLTDVKLLVKSKKKRITDIHAIKAGSVQEG